MNYKQNSQVNSTTTYKKEGKGKSPPFGGGGTRMEKLRRLHKSLRFLSYFIILYSDKAETFILIQSLGAATSMKAKKTH